MSISDDGNNDAKQVADCAMSSIVKVIVFFSCIVNHKKVKIWKLKIDLPKFPCFAGPQWRKADSGPVDSSGLQGKLLCGAGHQYKQWWDQN